MELRRNVDYALWALHYPKQPKLGIGKPTKANAQQIILKKNIMKLNYNWNLKDAIFTKDKGKVFSCFSCGGGSTMGYKLAGFDVIGCNEIAPKNDASL